MFKDPYKFSGKKVDEKPFEEKITLRITRRSEVYEFDVKYRPQEYDRQVVVSQIKNGVVGLIERLGL